MVHVDWMIGSEEVDVDGLLEDGTRVPLMRRGRWVI
jgi:aminopeptidase